MILPDANVLVYARNTTAPQHPASLAFIEQALQERFPVVLVPQVLLEFFAIATNDRRTTQPISAAAAIAQMRLLRSSLPVLDVPVAALNHLEDSVLSLEVRGPAVYDRFIAAQMRAHGIPTICTYNLADFSRIPGIDAATPETILARFGL